MIHFALLITAAAMVIYTYGLLSPSTAIAFFSISLGTLAFAAKKLGTSIRLKSYALESTEKRYFFGGNCYRTFADTTGTLWLRDEDIRRHISTRYPAKGMARKYPQYFRKANPLVDAWYVHPKALRSLVRNSSSESDAAILKFLETEVIGVHYGLLSLGGRNGIIPEPLAPAKRLWIHRFWNGDLGLITTIIFGGILVYAVGVACDFLYPDEFVIHYQRSAAVYLASIISTVGLLFWWGHGIILATLHWLSSGRSLLMAFSAILLGTYLLIQSLDPFIKKYDQYSFAEWLSILTDKDEKAAVYFDPSIKAIIINGELGFGTTIKFIDLLEKMPAVKLVSLHSPGGRAAEGFAIYDIIKEREMDTLVFSYCASACTFAFVAGNNRYVRESTVLGLHRSGLHWDREDKGLSEIDLLMAQLFRGKGVQEWLIQRGLVPSIHGIYEPSVQEMLDGNLATGLYNTQTLHAY